MKNKIYGVATNDLIGIELSQREVSYKNWHNMIRRCYDPKSIKNHPTYVKCFVCDDWLIYSNFKKWYDLNHRNGCCLDKDLKFPGNTVYSPDTCSFIPNYINVLLTDRANDRGKYPLGVSYEPDRNRYKACLSIHGRVKHIGYFNNPHDAHIAWANAKKKYVSESATLAFWNREIDESIYNSLMSLNFLSE